MALKCNKSSDWNSASPACRILLLIPEAPEDLSGKSFLIWVVSSSRLKGMAWMLNACTCTEL